MQQARGFFQGKGTKEYFLRIFFLTAVVGFALLAGILGTILLISRGDPFRVFSWDIFALGGRYAYSDYLETITFCFLENPYADADAARCIYFPISYLILYPFALLGKDAANAYLSDLTLIQHPESLPGFLASYLPYVVLSVGIILFLIAYFSRLKGWNLFYLLVGSLLHGSVIYTFARGNTIFIAFIGVILFFGFYNDHRPWAREIGYLGLALAIAIKAYPVLLAMVFFRERRFFPLVRTALYTVALAFLPFLLVPGGFSNVALLLHNMSAFSGDNMRMHLFNNITWASLIAKIQYAFDLLVLWGKEGFSAVALALSRYNDGFAVAQATRVISMLIGVLASVFTFVMSCFKPKEKSSFPYLALLFTNFMLFPMVHYCYVHLFFLLLVLVYLHEFPSFSKNRRILYGVALLLPTFSLPYLVRFVIPGFVAQLILFVGAVIDLSKLYWGKNPSDSEPISPGAEHCPE
ncbi:MAG: glycosyltransferase family 87 protein [Candidatus Enteromonas sp.]|nr:glycosyltransferase family 87 protein [Candidatus Enteromonas sp.]